MDISMRAWLSSILVDWREARVSPALPGFNRASAVFEVMAVVPAANGPAVICLAEHVYRFFSSAEQVYMNLPYTPGQILDAVLATARSNRVENGVVKCYALLPRPRPRAGCPARRFGGGLLLDYTVLGVEPDKYTPPVRRHLLVPEAPSRHRRRPCTKITGNYTNGYLARTGAQKRLEATP